MAEKAVYRNHCQPQEMLNFSISRDMWYLDSDCGRKLTGNCLSKATSFSSPITGTLAASTTIIDIKFIFVKNTGKTGDDSFTLNIGSMGAHILLEPGDSFASDLGSTSSDDSTITLALLDAEDRPKYQVMSGG